MKLKIYSHFNSFKCKCKSRCKQYPIYRWGYLHLLHHAPKLHQFYTFFCTENALADFNKVWYGNYHTTILFGLCKL